jgi:hypothetical protein
MKITWLNFNKCIFIFIVFLIVTPLAANGFDPLWNQVNQEYNHAMNASTVYETKANEWRVIYKSGANSDVILFGFGKLTYCDRDWSPDDKWLQIDNDKAAYLWSPNGKKISELKSILPVAALKCKEQSVYGEWVSTDTLWVHIFCSPWNYFYTIGDKMVKPLNSISSGEGSVDKPVLYWDLPCSKNSLFERDFGDDDGRKLYSKIHGKEKKIQDDYRVVIAKWNEKCNAAMILNENGANSTELYLLKTNRDSPINFVTELIKVHPEYQWLEDCIQLWCRGAWLNNDEIQVEISGQLDNKLKTNYFERMLCKWNIDGTITIMRKHIWVKNWS